MRYYEIGLPVAALALAAAWTTGPVAAQDADSGFYIAGKGGVTLKADDQLTGRDPSTLSVDLEHDAGFGVGAAVGYWVNWFRVEVEYTHFDNSLDKLNFSDDSGLGVASGFGGPLNGEIESGVTGEAISDNFMLNLYADFNLEGKVKPYLGVGIGAADVDRREQAVDGVNLWSTSEWGVAGQALAGFRVDMSDRVLFDLGYRYFFTEKIDVVTRADEVARGSYDTHGLFAGIAFKFGNPQPPAREAEPRTIPDPGYAPVERAEPVEPPPPPPEPYLVYFAFDDASISAAARRTISNAVQDFREYDAASIELVGHADRSGSNQYNLDLSRKRAEAVRDVLVSMGISESAIRLEYRGEADNLVPTPDGVREPRNRRVKIFLRE